MEGYDTKDKSKYFGKTRNFKSVSFQSDKDLIGKLVRVKITEVKGGLLEGDDLTTGK